MARIVEGGGAQEDDAPVLLSGQAASVGTVELLERSEELTLLRAWMAAVSEQSRGRLSGNRI